MGLIRAAVGAVGGTMADQWREFFYCEAMDADTLVVKGQKAILENIRFNWNGAFYYAVDVSLKE